MTSLDQFLAMPDIAPIAEGRRVTSFSEVPVAFVVPDRAGELRLGPAAFDAVPGPRIAIRHGLELLVQLELWDDPVLAGLAAARTGALFALLEVESKRLAACGPWFGSLASPEPARHTDLEAAWSLLARHQPGAPARVSVETAEWVRRLWGLLGPAEYLMGIGGDVRLRTDPETGLNQYGCSARPRPWAVTFASSTASSISERGYAGAERARRKLFAGVARAGVAPSLAELAAGVRRGLADFYHLPPAAQIVLTPSGTDGELCALAVASLATPARPISSILLAAEETGTGIPLAATGRHFADLTARGVRVAKGSAIEGFPADVEVVSVRARSIAGQVRRDQDVRTECTASVKAALSAGRRVVFHVMDQSKTGLKSPRVLGPIGLEGPDVDVVVDACQARLSAESIGDYLRRGFMVMLTGSKFFTGPPFAGALVIPPALARRVDEGAGRLPAGLRQYLSPLEWPSLWEAGSLDGNVGLFFRWCAALAEMDAFAGVGAPGTRRILSHFGQRIREAIQRNPDLHLHEMPAAALVEEAESWDALPTIFTFSIRIAPADQPHLRRLLNLDEARQVYRWLNSDLSDCALSAPTESERALARQQFHLGQPVAISDQGGTVGGLRISAGARLISGEPSQAALAPESRLAREIDDALAALAKISLIVRNYAAIGAVDPSPQYRVMSGRS